jgi:hypothetical protein
VICKWGIDHWKPYICVCIWKQILLTEEIGTFMCWYGTSPSGWRHFNSNVTLFTFFYCGSICAIYVSDFKLCNLIIMYFSNLFLMEIKIKVNFFPKGHICQIGTFMCWYGTSPDLQLVISFVYVFSITRWRSTGLPYQRMKEPINLILKRQNLKSTLSEQFQNPITKSSKEVTSNTLYTHIYLHWW